MTSYDLYKLALEDLRVIAAQKDFSAAGDEIYNVAYDRVKRLYLIVYFEGVSH